MEPPQISIARFSVNRQPTCLRQGQPSPDPASVGGLCYRDRAAYGATLYAVKMTVLILNPERQRNGPSAGGTEAACVGTPDWRGNRGEGLPAEFLHSGERVQIANPRIVPAIRVFL